MTSSNGNMFALLALCVGNSPVTGEFPGQRPVTRSFDVSFDLRLNRRLIEQLIRRSFEMLSRSLWRDSNDYSAFEYKDSFSRYDNSYCKKNMSVMRRSYLYDENPCTDKTSSLCSNDPLVAIIMMKWEKLPHWYIHFWCYIRKCNGYLYQPNAVHSCDLIGWCSFMI